MCLTTTSSATMFTETSTSTTKANGVSAGQESVTKTNGAMASGEGGAAAAAKRRRRSSLHRLNKIDEFISDPVFRLGLPKWLELLYSFPANIFGSTFSLMVMPLWIGLLALLEKQLQQQQQQQYITNNDTSNLMLLKFITIGLTAVYMIAWGFFQYGYDKVGMKLIWRRGLYIGGAPWCVAVLAYTLLGFHNDAANNNNNNNNNNKMILSMAIYPLFLWPFVILIITYLKKTSRRHRPAYKDYTIRPNDHVDDKSRSGKRINTWIDNKKYLAVPYMLAEHNGNAAFPSGDAAMAALFALPIFYIGGGDDRSYYYKAIASTIIFLSASGRMYVLAHHFLDVIVGIAITYLVHLISSSSFVGFGMYDMEWWYPLVMTSAYFLYQKLTKKTAAAGNEAGNNEYSKKKK